MGIFFFFFISVRLLFFINRIGYFICSSFLTIVSSLCWSFIFSPHDFFPSPLSVRSFSFSPVRLDYCEAQRKGASEYTNIDSGQERGKNAFSKSGYNMCNVACHQASAVTPHSVKTQSTLLGKERMIYYLANVNY